jgi:hypothetical protein
MHRSIVVVSLAGLLALNHSLGAAGTATAGSSRSIGFRGDNTGIFPADCKPPAEFDGVKGKNLVWKAPRQVLRVRQGSAATAAPPDPQAWDRKSGLAQ